MVQSLEMGPSLEAAVGSALSEGESLRADRLLTLGGSVTVFAALVLGPSDANR